MSESFPSKRLIEELSNIWNDHGTDAKPYVIRRVCHWGSEKPERIAALAAALALQLEADFGGRGYEFVKALADA